MSEQLVDFWSEALRHTVMGAAGGLAGLVAFRLYWKGAELIHGTDVRTLRGGAVALDEQDVAEQMHRDRVEATGDTVRMAEGKANPIPDNKPPGKGKYTVHWSYPVIVGAAYGVVRAGAEVHPAEGIGGGAALWASVDEVLAPLTGTRSGTAERPIMHHTHRLLSHIVMGVVSVTATQALKRSFPSSRPTRQERFRRKMKLIASHLRELSGT